MHHTIIKHYFATNISSWLDLPAPSIYRWKHSKTLIKCDQNGLWLAILIPPPQKKINTSALHYALLYNKIYILLSQITFQVSVITYKNINKMALKWQPFWPSWFKTQNNLHLLFILHYKKWIHDLKPFFCYRW